MYLIWKVCCEQKYCNATYKYFCRINQFNQKEKIMKTAYLASILIALIVAQIIPLASEEFGSGAARTITRAKNNVDVESKTQQVFEISLLP